MKHQVLTAGAVLVTFMAVGCTSSQPASSMASKSQMSQRQVQRQVQRQPAAAPSQQQAPTSTSMASSTDQTFEYYPNQEVYFSADQKLYFFKQNGEWQSNRRLPGSITLRASDAVMVPLGVSEPFRVHASIVSAFPPSTSTAGVSTE